MAAHAQRMGFDWSAQDSGVPRSAVRAAAVQVARDLLVESGEGGAARLAGATEGDLLRRLRVLSEAGTLSNAGALPLTTGGVTLLVVTRGCGWTVEDSRYSKRSPGSTRRSSKPIGSFPSAADLS